MIARYARGTVFPVFQKYLMIDMGIPVNSGWSAVIGAAT
jgi:hypothetical protein